MPWKNHGVDSLDRAIVQELLIDGRISNAALAQKVGLTPGPCLRRVQRLESEGVIQGYTALIDPSVMDQSFEVGISIDLKQGDHQTVQHFETTVSEFDEVLELLRLFGKPDYYARVAVADLQAYERFLTTKLLPIAGVTATHSAFPMKIIKSTRAHASSQ